MDEIETAETYLEALDAWVQATHRALQDTISVYMGPTPPRLRDYQ